MSPFNAQLNRLRLLHLIFIITGCGWLMAAFAPICDYKGRRAAVRALIRLATSRVRDPIQVVYARIAARAWSIAA